MSPCPSDITIADFAQGQLSEAARRTLEQHLDSCPTCRELIVGLVKSDTVRAPELTCQGDRVGRYQLRRRIGAGAMGVVYEAFDPELARRVAVKVIRTEVDGREAEKRLRREAQSMARLSHPNVVAIHDVGEDRGEVFLVMEYVEGGSLTEWLRAAPRAWHEVLAVYLAAGGGLEAAHRIGVVHRDFKPDNVVVGQDGRVGITDFGLAGMAADIRSAGSHATIAVTHTGVIMGTPMYMAPEVHAGARADARSDLFSFCVALYEGLVGQRPYAGETVAELAAAKLSSSVRPPPPSSPVPAALLAIVVRGLATDPAERPTSMGELTAALAQHLERRRSRWRRRVAALAGAAAIAATGTVWSGVFGRDPCAAGDELLAGVWDAGRRKAIRDAFAGVARPYAAQLALVIESRVGSYAGAWRHAARAACEDTHVRRVQSETVLDRRMDCLRVRRRELAAFADLLTRVDAASALALGRGAFELGDLESCADSAARLSPPRPAVAARVQRLREELGGARALLVRAPAQAAARLQALLAEARSVGYGPLVAEAYLAIGRAHEVLGEYRPAEATHVAAAAAAIASRHDEAAAIAWTELVHVVGSRAMDFDRAAQWVPLAQAALDSLGRPPALVARLRWREGELLAASGRFREAEPVLRRAVDELAAALAPADPTVAAAMLTLGMVLGRLGNSAEAVALVTRARLETEAHWGAAHPQVAAALHRLATLADRGDDMEKAIALYRQALAIREAAFGENHPEVADTHLSLGGTLERAGDLAGATDQLERALAIKTKALGSDHADLALILQNLGNVYDGRGDLEAALDHYRRAVAIARRALGEDHVDLADSLHNVGYVLYRMGRQADALATFRDVAVIYEKALGAGHPDVAVALSAVGELLMEMGRPDEAIATHERAVAIYERSDPKGCGQKHADVVASLATALWRSGKSRHRARALAREALRCLKTLEGPEAAAHRDQLVKLVGDHPPP